MNIKKIIAFLLSLTICAAVPLSSHTGYTDIEVQASAYSADTFGMSSTNISSNNSYNYGSVIKSYLYEDSEGTLTRVEYFPDDCITVEQYTETNNLISSKSIDIELTRFGGFFCGNDYNYLVFGNPDTDEKSDVESIRVVKYTKNWERVSQCSLYDINTYIPFSHGSLRMTETDGKLYIHSCHTMYKSYDGLNHQANMTFVINEADMTAVQQSYEVSNISTGYASHSFNQFIDTDGSYIYRVDQGDAYPRGIAVTRSPLDNIKDVDYIIPLEFGGSIGKNATNAGIGGMTLAGGNCIVGYISVNQKGVTDTNIEDSANNLYIMTVKKDMSGSEIKQITNYTEGDGHYPNTPQVVKCGENKILVMWEEFDESGLEYQRTYMMTVDSDGNTITPPKETRARLSDCQPFLSSDGLVKWYVTNDSSPCMYFVNPDSLPDIEEPVSIGDVNGDNKITAEDALAILQSVTQDSSFNASQIKSADIDGDGKVTTADALMVLQYIVGLREQL